MPYRATLPVRSKRGAVQGSTSATNRHCRPPCHSRSLFRDRLRAGYENGTSTRYAIKQSNRAHRISNAGRNETPGSSYSLPPPSTFRFDQIFQCEQFDTELSAPWGPHGSWAMRSRRVKMAFIRETEEFDQETLHILGNALDEAWRRVKSNHLNGRAYGARTVLAQHIFAMAKQGERDPHRLIDGALMRLTL